MTQRNDDADSENKQHTTKKKTHDEQHVKFIYILFKIKKTNSYI